MRRPAFIPDNFVLLLLATVALASLLPVHGTSAQAVKWLTNAAVAGLFFLHGAKLSREAVVAGLLHWRLHLTVFSATFVLFPILGLALRPLFEPLIGPTLYLGVLFICALPSTVQSSIAFTSIGKGNVPAAMCSASTSNIVGIALTPLLIAAMASTSSAGSSAAGVMSWHSAAGIVGLLLLPFVAGQIAQRWIGGWVARHRGMLKWFDQGSILLVVYSAFSEATVEGLYQQVSLGTLGILVGISAVLLFLLVVSMATPVPSSRATSSAFLSLSAESSSARPLVAPASSRRRTMAVFPLRTASMRALSPFWSVALALAP
ncbi:MAG: bile acid:sodium symporter, partial [Aquincola sp.]|nr:bile acid:sodium symporter [Aquincola sp.]